MYKCPACKERQISFWQKVFADRVKPATCRNCNPKLYKSFAPQMKYYYLAFIPVALISFMALNYRVLWLYPLGLVPFIWAFLLGVKNAPLNIKK